MYKCPYCDNEYETKHGYTTHVKYCKLNPEAVPCKTGHTAWNKGLTVDTDDRVRRGAKTRADNIATGKVIIKGHTHSLETRERISASRKKYLQENPDKHVWKRLSKFKSVPCETLKEKLRSMGVTFIEEYCPFDDCAIALDIAFPHLMIGIEVNGNQHYNRDGSLKDYYQRRHDKLTEAGWVIYEIHYTLCFNIKNFESILSLDVYNKDYVNNYFLQNDLRKSLRKTASQKDIEQKIIRQQLKETEIERRKDIIISSGIDFTKYGWVTKVSKLLNITPQKVTPWMRKYMPEFYSSCFKRV